MAFLKNISHIQFENFNEELFHSTKNPVTQISKSANMSKCDVADIVEICVTKNQNKFNRST